MKIAKIESLHCDAGTRNFDFLKLTTDTGLVGWSDDKEMQIPPVKTLDDIVELGKEVVSKGFTALKTNALLFGDNPRNYAPGFARTGEGFPELNPERYVIKAVRDQLAAFREGAGPDVD